MNIRLRHWISSFIAYWIRISARKIEKFESRLDDFQTFDRDGFLYLGNLLSSADCSILHNFLKGCQVIQGTSDDNSDFINLSDAKIHGSQHVFYHRPEDVIKAPFVLEIANNKRVLSIVERALGAPSTISYITAWWSFKPKEEYGPEKFHRDVDDWRFFKLFVYLSDVSNDNGPHVYVKGTHKDTRGIDSIRRFSDSEVEDMFIDRVPMKISGKAGSAFLENTFGFHKGLPVMTGERLVLQVVYSLSPLPYSPPKPILFNPEYSDYRNRLYIYE